LVGGWWLAGIIGASNYGIDTDRLGVYGAAAALLAVTMMAAVWGPARTAMRTDPAKTLK
jgi:hypothetical protein